RDLGKPRRPVAFPAARVEHRAAWGARRGKTVGGKVTLEVDCEAALRRRQPLAGVRGPPRGHARPATAARSGTAPRASSSTAETSTAALSQVKRAAQRSAPAPR